MPNEAAAEEFKPKPEVPASASEAPERGAGFEAPPAPPAARPEAAPSARPAAEPVVSPAARPPKDPAVRAVESILEEDLADAYAALPPAAKKKFREEGERVTREIVGMVASLKITARKVLGLIRGWLRLIPGVNRFFLEQEAKIKTDKVMRLAEEERKRRETAI